MPVRLHLGPKKGSPFKSVVLRKQGDSRAPDFKKFLISSLPLRALFKKTHRGGYWLPAGDSIRRCIMVSDLNLPLVRRDLSGDDAIKKRLNVTMPLGTLVPKWYPNFLLSYKTIRTDVREYPSYNREMMKEFIYRRII